MCHGFPVKRDPQALLPAADAIKRGDYTCDIVQKLLSRAIRSLLMAAAHTTHLVAPRGDDLMPDGDVEIFQERRDLG